MELLHIYSSGEVLEEVLLDVNSPKLEELIALAKKQTERFLETIGSLMIQPTNLYPLLFVLDKVITRVKQYSLQFNTGPNSLIYQKVKEGVCELLPDMFDLIVQDGCPEIDPVLELLKSWDEKDFLSDEVILEYSDLLKKFGMNYLQKRFESLAVQVTFEASSDGTHESRSDDLVLGGDADPAATVDLSKKPAASIEIEDESDVELVEEIDIVESGEVVCNSESNVNPEISTKKNDDMMDLDELLFPTNAYTTHPAAYSSFEVDSDYLDDSALNFIETDPESQHEMSISRNSGSILANNAIKEFYQLVGTTASRNQRDKFYCRNADCSFEFAGVQNVVTHLIENHIQSHIDPKDERITCIFSNCNSTLNNLNSLATHIRRHGITLENMVNYSKHQEQQAEYLQLTSKLLDSICITLVNDGDSKNERSFSLRCATNGCDFESVDFGDTLGHIYHTHTFWFDEKEELKFHCLFDGCEHQYGEITELIGHFAENHALNPSGLQQAVMESIKPSVDKTKRNRHVQRSGSVPSFGSSYVEELGRELNLTEDCDEKIGGKHLRSSIRHLKEFHNFDHSKTNNIDLEQSTERQISEDKEDVIPSFVHEFQYFRIIAEIDSDNRKKLRCKFGNCEFTDPRLKNILKHQADQHFKVIEVSDGSLRTRCPVPRCSKTFPHNDVYAETLTGHAKIHNLNVSKLQEFAWQQDSSEEVFPEIAQDDKIHVEEGDDIPERSVEESELMMEDSPNRKASVTSSEQEANILNTPLPNEDMDTTITNKIPSIKIKLPINDAAFETEFPTIKLKVSPANEDGWLQNLALFEKTFNFSVASVNRNSCTFRCNDPKCKKIPLETLTSVLLHRGEFHSKGQKVPCPIPDCNKSFALDDCSDAYEHYRKLHGFNFKNFIERGTYSDSSVPPARKTPEKITKSKVVDKPEKIKRSYASKTLKIDADGRPIDISEMNINLSFVSGKLMWECKEPNCTVTHQYAKSILAHKAEHHFSKNENDEVICPFSKCRKAFDKSIIQTKFYTHLEGVHHFNVKAFGFPTKKERKSGAYLESNSSLEPEESGVGDEANEEMTEFCPGSEPITDPPNILADMNINLRRVSGRLIWECKEPRCAFTHHLAKSILVHKVEHHFSRDENDDIICPFSNCKKVYDSSSIEKGFHSHLDRAHRFNVTAFGYRGRSKRTFWTQSESNEYTGSEESSADEKASDELTEDEADVEPKAGVFQKRTNWNNIQKYLKLRIEHIKGEISYVCTEEGCSVWANSLLRFITHKYDSHLEFEEDSVHKLCVMPKCVGKSKDARGMYCHFHRSHGVTVKDITNAFGSTKTNNKRSRLVIDSDDDDESGYSSQTENGKHSEWSEGEDEDVDEGPQNIVSSFQFYPTITDDSKASTEVTLARWHNLLKEICDGEVDFNLICEKLREKISQLRTQVKFKAPSVIVEFEQLTVAMVKDLISDILRLRYSTEDLQGALHSIYQIPCGSIIDGGAIPEMICANNGAGTIWCQSRCEEPIECSCGLVYYCSEQCQAAHSTIHEEVCNKAQQTVVDTFFSVPYGNSELLPTTVYNFPAVNILREEKESSDILFSEVTGDLRHVISTTLEIPTNSGIATNIFMNHSKDATAIRTALVTFYAIVYGGINENNTAVAESVLHWFYSLKVTEQSISDLIELVWKSELCNVAFYRPESEVEAFCFDGVTFELAEKTITTSISVLNAEFGDEDDDVIRWSAEVFCATAGSKPKSISMTFTRRIWKKVQRTCSELDVEVTAFEQLNRNRLMNIGLLAQSHHLSSIQQFNSRRKRIRTHLEGLSSAHRKSLMEYYKHFCLVPFGFNVQQLNRGNRLRFDVSDETGNLDFIVDETMNPFEIWHSAAICNEPSYAPENDIFGRLFYFTRNRISEFLLHLNKLEISFHVSANLDDLSDKKFDRILTSVEKDLLMGSLKEQSDGPKPAVLFARLNDNDDFMDAEDCDKVIKIENNDIDGFSFDGKKRFDLYVYTV